MAAEATSATPANAAASPAATPTLASAPVSDPYEPLNAAAVNAQYFKGRASERWVADRMPAGLAFRIGKERHWHRHVVDAAVRALAGAA